ncbi:PREDICTED: large proline-rich protein BAG6-like [Nelumbo nucifera]|uniref:Large proline-rich protein BAG6-like n=1 Tax=Nelumbo nucifera TaxID=4432 RepID=A0A1U7Z2J5_NELNU|nr:PREDICTED: large proline-rich protein BAG6-like [Nelumbo nucifera]
MPGLFCLLIGEAQQHSKNMNKVLIGIPGRMGSNDANELMISGSDEAECSEATVEIKIKTLDSQTYTLRVNKCVPVPALKEQIATITGVLSEQQRLICRGKVLKDDQLLSAYHVEDGHTLHLVVRQPVPPSSASTMGFIGPEGSPDHPASEPTTNTSHSQGNQVAHSVVLGTFNIADQGDGVLPDINRIVSAVLGSIFTNIGSGSEGANHREPASERLERTSGASVPSDSVRSQPGQPTAGVQSDPLHGAFRLPTPASLGPLQAPVIPDSLATLSQYINRMRHEFRVIARSHSSNSQPASTPGNEGRDYDSASRSNEGQAGLPTPASLAEVILSTRQMLIDQAGECLYQLTRQLEDQGNITDPLMRMTIQSNAMRSGVFLQNLGALLLELGRATMMLRMGRTPSEAVVNAGPSVFISNSGPNPIMVQPLPFQPGTSFGAVPIGAVHPGSSLVGGTLGSGFIPRNIDIRIRTATGSSVPTANVNQGEQAGVRQPSGPTNSVRPSGSASGASGSPSFAGESGVRVVPIRTVVAAVPAPVNRPASDSSGSSIGLFYPLLARVQHVTSGHFNSTRDSQVSGDRPPSVPETVRHPIPESVVQNQNISLHIGTSRDADSANVVVQNQQGSLPTSSSRQSQPSDSNNNNNNNNNNNLSSGRIQNGQESAAHISNRFDQLLRTIFPGEQISVGEANFPGMSTGSATEHVGTAGSTANAREATSRVESDDGIFLSNLLRQVMPVISQVTAIEQNAPLPEGVGASEHRTAHDSSTQTTESSNSGTTRRCSDNLPTPPDSKRQKRE